MDEDSFSWPEILTGLVRGRDLGSAEASWAMGEILRGQATAVQIAGFAVALRAKGESVSELVDFSAQMLEMATPLELPGPCVDVVGTGGDRANTVNISTMAGIVAAGAGARVAKHGNRAASSACGTADVLEALGVAIDLDPDRQAEVLDTSGIVFLFAPRYHPSLRHAGPVRRELGIATTFNLLGPLANPARPEASAVGVADERAAGLIAGVLADRGDRGLVFHGGDGLDELTTTTDSRVWIGSDHRVSEQRLDPQDLGLPRCTPDQLVGADAGHNAQVVHQVLGGADGPVRDIVLLNAAATLLAFHGPQHEVPLAEQLRPHLDAAVASIDSGRAADILDRWAAATRV